MIPDEPYNLWEVSENDFPKQKDINSKCLFLVKYAALAPSSHNTQPWKFKVKDNTINMLPDLNRTLSYSDRTHRELYISLGCALANLLVAAEYFNLKSEVTYLPEDDLTNVAASIKLFSTDNQSENNSKSFPKQLFPNITKRVTNRYPVTNVPIKNPILTSFKKINQDEAIEIKFITEPNMTAQVAKLLYESTLFAFSDKIFKLELSNWVRSIYTRQLDGIPLFGFGLPDLLTIIAPLLIKQTPAKMQADMDSKLVKNSASLLILTARSDDKEAWLKVGVTFELIALSCQQMQISIAPMAAIIEYEKTNHKLQKILNTKDKPMFFARMGYTNKIPHHSPRRDILDLII